MILLNFSLIVLSTNILVYRIWRLFLPAGTPGVCGPLCCLSKTRRRAGGRPGNHKKVGVVLCGHLKRQYFQLLVSFGH